MSHKTTTTVTHTFDLEPSEVFEEKGYRKTALRIDQFIVRVIDGSISGVTMWGAPVLKSGAVGRVRSDVSAWRPYPEHVKKILRAHGISVAS